MSTRIDETQPGGYYIGTDGVPHDAHGNLIVETPAVASEQPDGVAPKSEPEPVKAAKKGKGAGK